jgi:hypothetical protein
MFHAFEHFSSVQKYDRLLLIFHKKELKDLPLMRSKFYLNVYLSTFLTRHPDVIKLIFWLQKKKLYN